MQYRYTAQLTGGSLIDVAQGDNYVAAVHTPASTVLWHADYVIALSLHHRSITPSSDCTEGWLSGDCM